MLTVGGPGEKMDIHCKIPSPSCMFEIVMGSSWGRKWMLPFTHLSFSQSV